MDCKNKLKELSIGKAGEMISVLKTISSDLTFNDLKQGVNGIFDTIANSMIVRNKKNIFLLIFNAI